MLIPIVDENDVVIGMKERDAIEQGDICRASALWLTNSHGDILIARRALSKKHNPGLWSCAVAGTVDGQETYEENMLKETEEEIGLVLSPSDLTMGPKARRKRIFLQWYFATKDVSIDDLRMQEEEVMDLRWISSAELREWVAERPVDFVDSMCELFATLP
jgi:isopentenyldiphosphate isomerase